MSTSPPSALANAQPQMQVTMRGQRQLSLTRTWGYGVGDFGINLFFMSAMTYLMYFYTDVFGISAASAGGVIFVARVIDAVTDPLMGMAMDRTRSRWGPMRPYLLFGALPLGAFAVAVFTVPDFSATGKLVWAYAMYIGFGIAYTIVGLPYSSLTARMTDDYDERTTLSTVRMACAFSGGLLVSAGMPWLVGLADSEAQGYQQTMLLFAVVAIVLIWVSFGSAQETNSALELDKHNRAKQKASFGTLNFDPILKNPHLWVVIGVFCCGMLGFTLRSAATPYYFKYYVERPDLIGTYFLVTLSVMVVGLIGVPMLADKLGKTRALYIGAVVTLIGCLLLYLMPKESIFGIFASGSLVALGATPVAVLGWAMLPDTVEYAQLRHGVRADGLIYSTASFVQKLGKGVGGAVIGAMLTATGYVANTQQSPETINAIVGLMTWAPAAVLVPLVICAALYRLDETTHRDIVAQLQARARGA